MTKFKTCAFLLLITSLGFQSCDNDDNGSIPASVPMELQNAFSKMYPSVSPKWETKGDYYVADFRNNSFDAEAWYMANGEWYMTETDISYSALPVSVKASFEASVYSTWKVDDVDKLERREMATTYVIEADNKNQDVDLYYSENGVLIKTVVEAENDNDNDDNNGSGYLPSTELTAAMKSFIETKYVNSKIIEVDIEDDRNEPEFGFIEVDIIHNEIHKEVLFDKSKVWFLTSWEVSSFSLPAEIKKAVSIQYPNYRIDDADFYEKPNNVSYYQLELEGNNMPDKLVKYLPDGNIYL